MRMPGRTACRAAAATLVALAKLAAAQDPPINAGIPHVVHAPRDPAVVRFVATGDFGEGNTAQVRVAEAIKSVCDRNGCDFVAGLGDNIYDVGVKDECDSLFDQRFENPYTNLSMRWYMTLGNHDNSHDPVLNSPAGDAAAALSDEVKGVGAGHWYEAGNREVRYHYRTAQTQPCGARKSGKWFMPARFYQVSAGTVDLFALDTNTAMYMGLAFPYPPLEDAFRKQELWIQGALATSVAEWKIAFGHHPYRSNGEHGSAGFYEGAPMTPISGPYVKTFYEQLVCDRVDLVIAGHDHDLQWLHPVAECGRTEFIVSGAGAKTRGFPSCGTMDENFFRPCNEPYVQKGDTLGFFWIEIRGSKLTGVLYTVPKSGPVTAAETYRRCAVKTPGGLATASCPAGGS